MERGRARERKRRVEAAGWFPRGSGPAPGAAYWPPRSSLAFARESLHLHRPDGTIRLTSNRFMKNMMELGRGERREGGRVCFSTYNSTQPTMGSSAVTQILTHLLLLGISCSYDRPAPLWTGSLLLPTWKQYRVFLVRFGRQRRIDGGGWCRRRRGNDCNSTHHIANSVAISTAKLALPQREACKRAGEQAQTQCSVLQVRRGGPYVVKQLKKKSNFRHFMGDGGGERNQGCYLRGLPSILAPPVPE